MTFRHTADMGEISGFGGGYEDCCQDMLEAGVLWLEANPQRGELKGQTIKDVYGIFDATSDDAKALEAAVLAGAKGEATGAMHHAVMSILFWISAHSWDEYCAFRRKSEAAADG
jgi:hypothetical protein